MNAVVTGGAGFVGSHLVRALLLAGHRVTVLDDLSTGRLANLAEVLDHRQFVFQRGSVTDPQVVRDVVDGADVVYHLAAVVGRYLTLGRPLLTARTNIGGSKVVLQAAARTGARLVFASSSEVYGNSARIPLSESDGPRLPSPANRRCVYARSKLIGERLALACHRQRGTDIVIARFFNIIGPRQSGRYGMVVPRFVDQALRRQPITVYGDGQQTRSFMDVDDAVSATIRLSETARAGGRIINVGTVHEITIAELAYRVRTLAWSDSPIRYVPYAAAYFPGFEDVRRRRPDISVLQELVGACADVGLDDSLCRVVASMRARVVAECRAPDGSERPQR